MTIVAVADLFGISGRRQELVGALDGLLARPSELTVYSVSGAARPLASGPMDPRDAD